MNKVVGVPECKVFAAVMANLSPRAFVFVSHTVGKAQIRCSYDEFVIPIACYSAVAYSEVAVHCPKNRFASVDFFPVIAVAADSEIDLFAVRCGFFSEMDEKVAVFLVV